MEAEEAEMKLTLQCYVLAFILIVAGVFCLFFTEELTPCETVQLVGLLSCMCGLTFFIILFSIEDGW